MAKVAQAYFHFDAYLSASELKKFGGQIDRVSRRAAARNFDTPALINVEIEEGSLIGRVTAYASILAIYTGLISDYKGVKDSVSEMYSDARSFGSEIIDKAVDLAGVGEKQVYRVERRTKTVGKLDRLLKDVRRLEQSVGDLSPTQMKRELARLSHELGVISKDLQPEEQAGLVKVLGETKLPPPSRWPKVTEGPRAVLRPDQLELKYEAVPVIEDQSQRRPARLRYQNSFKVEPEKRVKRAETLLIPKRP